jgi:hypothetical protein
MMSMMTDMSVISFLLSSSLRLVSVMSMMTEIIKQHQSIKSSKRHWKDDFCVLN